MFGPGLPKVWNPTRPREREKHSQGIEVLVSVLAGSAPLASYNLCPIEVYSELSYFWSTVTTF